MIVISGALVLVALVLLVIGLVSPDLAFVYASIVVSLASFAFLVVGIFQRRNEGVAGEDFVSLAGAGAVTSGIGAAVRAGELGLGRDDSATDGFTTLPPGYTGAAEQTSGTVLVVAGRPRYHVDGCRYLAGKDADAVDVADAREEGFTPCGVCKPDQNLTASAGSEVGDEVDVTEQTPVRAAQATASTKTAAIKTSATKSAATKSAATKSAATKSAATKTSATKTSATKSAATNSAPNKRSAKNAAAVPVTGGGVIVIPDRGKFHTPGCRYVRGAEGILELSRADAVKQGYDACGVCKP